MDTNTESSQELQDLYSSTSSDDQSSINSVVHVGGGLDESESDRSAPTTPKRLKPNGEIGGHRLHHQEDSTSDESELDEEALVRAEEERQRDEDSSSTSSEETQIWVPAHRPNGNHSGGAQGGIPKPNVPPKPSYRSSMGNNHSGNNGGIRHSVISQNSSTGKVEVVLVSEDQANSVNADSGISNESPEQQSGGERDAPSSAASSHHHHHHGHHHRQHSSLHSPRSHSSSDRSSQSSNIGLHAHMNAVQYHSSPSHNSNHSHVVTLPTIPSPSASPVTPHSILKSGDPLILPHPDEAFMKHHFRESLFNILSGLYAMFLVVIGASLPIAEVFATTIPYGVFEGFYIYLFLVSIIFLTYVYLFLLRSKTTSNRLKKRHNNRHSENALLKSPKRRDIAVSEVGNQHTGSFYLRLGAVGFGVGAMIHEGLMFGQVFETKLVAECIDITQVIRPVVQLAFTFIQLYFIFLNSKMCIHKYKVFARFGLMHMVATNLCVWLRVIVEETIREIHEHVHLPHGNRYHRSNNSNHHPTGVTYAPTTTVHVSFMDMEDESGEGPTYVQNNHSGEHGHEVAAVDCQKKEIISQVVEAASPFLYPCTIEYSLIAAGILYIMWRNIGAEDPPMTPEDQQNHIEGMKKQHRHTVDCAGANRGLFFGIFTLVGVIISMIVFFVLVDKEEYNNTAVMVVHISEVVLYFLALVAVTVAAIRIRDMNFHHERDNSLDEILLLGSLVGVLLFCVFSIVAGRYNVDSYGGLLIVASSVLIMVEAVVQTVFILNGLRRSSRIPLHESKKPGRECITYLLVCNVAMWGINTFEVMRSDSNPVAMEFYGFLPWSIITHISTPLAIFHRFHSTVCLASIWLDAYKIKTH